ncbi:MAG TPA: VWA domain-containing protein [Bryobacteraceae bacterium]|nr:VWA domain-containing protein [Bryobacteraceae bacterium]
MRTLLLVAAAVCLNPLSTPFLSAQTNESTPTTKVNVNEVSLDLVVRDAKGKVVRNLKPDDVQILENGVEQKIQDLHFVEGRDTTSTPPAGSRVAPLRTSNLVCVVLHNVDLHTRRFANEAVEEFVSKPLPPGTWVGVFNLAGGLSVLQQFTTDPKVVLAASKRAYAGSNPDFASSAALVNSANPTEVSVVGAGGSQGGPTSTGSQVVTGGEINNAAINDASVNTGMAANVARGQAAEDRRQFGGIEGMKAYEQMKNMIDQLGTLPGRKTVMLLSPGIVATGVEPDKFKSLVSSANEHDITIYGIDVNGMDTNSSALAGINMTQNAASSGTRTGIGGTNTSMDDAAAVAREGDVLHDAVRGSNVQAPLRMLSEGTGGAFAATNDLRKPLQKIVDDIGGHYEAVYHPSTEVWDGRLRRIEVKARSGLTVESRKAYFALPDASTLRTWDSPALIALGENPPPHPFDFGADAWQFRPEASGSQFALAFSVPGSVMTATAQPAQKEHRMHVSLVALVKDSKGNVVDKVSRDYPMGVADDKLDATKAQTLDVAIPFHVSPGHYTVETAVVDFEGHRTSTGKLEINSPEGNGGLAMSNVVLVSHAEPVNGKPDPADPFEFQGKRMIPMDTNKLKATDQPYVYFVVYPDKASTEKPRIDVEFLVGGESLAKQSADLPAADASGAIPMIVGAALKPGDCELKITAVQGNESATQSVKYTVAQQ